jgi:hypothetical protein
MNWKTKKSSGAQKLKYFDINAKKKERELFVSLLS